MADLLAFKFCIRTPLPRRAFLRYTVRRFGPCALGWTRGRALARSCIAVGMHRHGYDLQLTHMFYVQPGYALSPKRNASPYILLNLAPRSSSAIFARPQLMATPLRQASWITSKESLS
jgi:hypothetical protein